MTSTADVPLAAGRGRIGGRDVEDGQAHDDSTVGGGVPAAAHAVLAASLALALASLVLVAMIRPSWTSDQWYFVVDLSDAVIYGVVAWLLLLRSRHVVAWIVALTAVGGGLAALGSQWMQYHLAHPASPPLDLLTSMSSIGWVPGTLALFTVVPWLVRHDPLGLRERVAVGVGVGVIAAVLFGRLTDPWPWPEGEPIMPFAIRDAGWTDFLARVGRWEMAAVTVLGMVAAADVVRRWRTRSADARRGLGWLAIGTAVISISFLSLALPDSVAAQLPVALTPLLHLASQAFFPGAILVVVLGQRLWGIDLAVSRMLVWSLMTAGLTVAYVAVVTLLTTLLPVREGILQIVATAFVAAGFQPVKLWVQARVNRLVHGDAGEPLRAVRRVGRRLGTGAVHDLLDDVAAGVQASLRLDGVAILADPDGSGVPRAVRTVGRVDGDGVEVPLVVHQVEVGRLVAVPRPGESLDSRSRRSLDALAPIVAATVELSNATEALAESRARIAAARDEERRVLRRELHDGLGPALAGVGLTLRAGSNLLEADPHRACELFEGAADELDRRVEEVRGMARGLIPPVLDELGLLPALSDLAELHRPSGLQVRVDATPLPDLPADTAGAVYGIVSEAVRNVVRHAGAGSCMIRLRVQASSDGEWLDVAVSDDGAGIDPSASAGVGLSSMRERAEGAGGTLTIAPREPTGTVVRASVPLLPVQYQPSEAR